MRTSNEGENLELLNFAQLGIVVLSLTLAVFHFRLREKHLFHLTFAIYCLSTSLFVTHKLTSGYINPYHHFIGVFSVFTASGYWLFARAFFRKNNPINRHHLILVGLHAVCLVLLHLSLFSTKMWQLNSGWLLALTTALRETIEILYPGMLILIFWEGYRVLQGTNVVQRKVATIYLMSFSYCVVSVMLVGEVLPKELIAGSSQDWLSVFAFLLILLTTHGLIRFRQQQLNQEQINTTASDQEETELARQIQMLLVEEKRFLQSNLRVADIARELGVPEYRIRAVMLNQFDAKNFNHYVNKMRVEHAKVLLTALDKQDWPVLVVGIESGFASAAPFSRAFKEFTGCTPGQYRKQN